MESFGNGRIFLRGDEWYISVPCFFRHGKDGKRTKELAEALESVDEMVPFADAKTPWAAAAIAEQRHADCHAEYGKIVVAESRKAEIAAAEVEVARMEALIPQQEKVFAAAMEAAEEKGARAQEKRDEVRASGSLNIDALTQEDHDSRIATRAMLQEEELLASYREGLKHAKQRLRDTKKQNR